MQSYAARQPILTKSGGKALYADPVPEKWSTLIL